VKTVALLVLCGLLGALVWQTLRYRSARRGPVQDEQPLLHSPSAFHVLTFLRGAQGDDLLKALRELRGPIEAERGAKMVYAGRAAGVGLASSQLGASDWDAVALVQYPSRAAHDALASSPAYRAALGRFAATYSHGMHRLVLLNLAVPGLLLARRALDLVTRRPRRTPFQPTPLEERDERTRDAAERLCELRAYGGDAVVIANLLKQGNAEERAANRRYGLAMAGLFAEKGHGPMHVGRAVTLEGQARFDHVALVYYPGVDYLTRMIESSFFNEIVADKQPGDTLSLPTVPVLRQL
jgi:uncharacterized protein (DUF1330 family)